MRRHMCVADTQDPWARIRSRGRSEAADRVLNRSKGGVLVAGGELDVGEIFRFELSGPGEVRFAGLAPVAYSTNRATGLRFLDVDASADREIEDLIAVAIRRRSWRRRLSGSPDCTSGEVVDPSAPPDRCATAALCKSALVRPSPCSRSGLSPRYESSSTHHKKRM